MAMGARGRIWDLLKQDLMPQIGLPAVGGSQSRADLRVSIFTGHASRVRGSSTSPASLWAGGSLEAQSQASHLCPPQPAAQSSDHMKVIYKCLWQWSDPRRIGCGMQIHRRGSICCSVGVMPGTWSETLSLKNTCGARELVWESPPDIPEWSPHGAPWTVVGALINNRTWRWVLPLSCPGQGKHFNSEVRLVGMPAVRLAGPGYSPA